MGVKYFSFIEKFNFDSYTGKFTINIYNPLNNFIGHNIKN